MSGFPNIVHTEPPPAQPAAPAAPAAPPAQPAQVPTTGQPPSTPAPVTQPSTPAAPSSPPASGTPATSPGAANLDLPVVLPNGEQVLMRDLVAARSTVQELRLDDPDMASFMTTVSRASRGDQNAIQALTELGGQSQPAQPAAPQPAYGTQPAGVPPSAPAGHPPTPPAAPAAPATSMTGGSMESMVTAIKQAIEPIAERVNQVTGFMETIQRKDDVTKLTNYLTRDDVKTAFPNLSGNQLAINRVYSEWERQRTAAKTGGGPQPDFRDLQRIMQTEESYLKSALPPQPTGSNNQTEITRMDAPPNVIRGRPIPGRDPQPAQPMPAGYGSPTNPTVAAVSTTMPAAGAPGPAVAETPTNQPLTRESLAARLQSQANQIISQQR